MLTYCMSTLRTGCCKTTLARAAAGATAATFLTLSGAQLHSMYVGEGEAALRRAFARARLAAPAIVFIDELDSVAGASLSSSSGLFASKERGRPRGARHRVHRAGPWQMQSYVLFSFCILVCLLPPAWAGLVAMVPSCQ